MTSEKSPLLARLAILLPRLFVFTKRVFGRFMDNKGLLLAGSVAYNTLISIIPLFAVMLVFLTRFFPKEKVLSVIEFELDFITPGQAKTLTNEIAGILEHRELVEGLGIVVLLFFSSLSFRMLEDAIGILFNRPIYQRRQRLALTKVLKRDFWVSAVIPYVYILTIGLVLTLGTVLISVLEATSGQGLDLFGYQLKLGDIWNFGYWLLGFASQVLVIASIYKIMPTIKIRTKEALIGGLAAACLWESLRRTLAWYFANISVVGRIYGSLTTVIVVLVTIEVAAVILLLGAQVIAELRMSEAAELPWYEGVSADHEHEDGDHQATPPEDSDPQRGQA